MSPEPPFWCVRCAGVVSSLLHTPLGNVVPATLVSQPELVLEIDIRPFLSETEIRRWSTAVVPNQQSTSAQRDVSGLLRLQMNETVATPCLLGLGLVRIARWPGKCTPGLRTTDPTHMQLQSSGMAPEVATKLRTYVLQFSKTRLVLPDSDPTSRPICEYPLHSAKKLQQQLVTPPHRAKRAEECVHRFVGFWETTAKRSPALQVTTQRATRFVTRVGTCRVRRNARWMVVAARAARTSRADGGLAVSAFFFFFFFLLPLSLRPRKPLAPRTDTEIDTDGLPETLACFFVSWVGLQRCLRARYPQPYHDKHAGVFVQRLFGSDAVGRPCESLDNIIRVKHYLGCMAINVVCVNLPSRFDVKHMSCVLRRKIRLTTEDKHVDYLLCRATFHQPFGLIPHRALEGRSAPLHRG